MWDTSAGAAFREHGREAGGRDMREAEAKPSDGEHVHRAGGGPRRRDAIHHPWSPRERHHGWRPLRLLQPQPPQGG